MKPKYFNKDPLAEIAKKKKDNDDEYEPRGLVLKRMPSPEEISEEAQDDLNEQIVLEDQLEKDKEKL